MHFFHQQPRTNFYRSIALSFVLISLGIVGLIFVVSFSWATITIIPQTEYVQDSALFSVANDTQGEQDVVRGRLVRYDLQAAGTFTPSSSGILPQKPRGTITVKNSTAKSQPLVATTRLLSSNGTLFRMIDSSVVPSFGSSEVAVVADQESDVGDLSRERFILPGLWPGLQDKIYGEGFVQSQGGSAAVRIVAEEDSDRAKASLIAKIENQFAMMIETEGRTDDFQPAKMREIHRVTLMSQKSSHPVGSQTDSFDLSVDVRIDAVLFDEAEVKQYLAFVMSRNLGQGRELLPLDMSRMNISLEESDYDAQKARLKAHGAIGMTLGESFLALERKSLTGKTPQEVREYYERSVGASTVEVKLYPFWVTRTPLLYDHISLIVKRN